MAISIIIKSINISHPTALGTVSNADTEKTLTLSKSISDFNMLAFVYNVGKAQILTTPQLFRLFNTLQATADGTNKMQVTYVSDTSVKILTTQGSAVTVYGIY